MNEEQAKGILVFAKNLAGLSDQKPSLADYRSFLTFTIRPLFQTESRRGVFKKYYIENPEDFLGKLLEFQVEGKLNVSEMFLESFGGSESSQKIDGTNVLAKASGLAKYLRQKFLWKINELEKSLRTQLRDALDHQDFEHSGQPSSSCFSSAYWPTGKASWEVFNGDIETHIKSHGISHPLPSIKSFPDDGTQLPYPKDIRKVIHQIFQVLRSKLGFNLFLNWLDSDESPYRSKSLNAEFDQDNRKRKEKDAERDPGETEDDDTKSSGIDFEDEEIKDQEDALNFSQVLVDAEKLYSKMKPPVQKSFRNAFIWYGKYWSKSSLTLSDLESLLGKPISTLQEHFKKIEDPLFVKELMQKYPQKSDLLIKVFNHFREKYSEYNPEKTHPEFFSKVKES